MSLHQAPHTLLEIVFPEHAFLVNHKIQTVPALWEHVMLKRRRSEVGVNDVTWLIVQLANPFCKLHRVGNGCGKENVADFMWKQDNGLLPHDTSLCDS
jgi:hypothetical protein